MVVLAGSPWQQIQAFLRTLRGAHLPFHVPILCLVPPWEKISASTIQEVFQSHPRVAAMPTPATAKTQDLKQAGIKHARCVALLAGNAGDSGTVDRRMVDGTGVTLLCSLEAWFSDLVKGTTPPIILELHQQESVSFLHRFPLYERAGEDTERMNAKENYINHPRFAGGGIFTGSCMGALLARAYYTPGIVELLEALVIVGSTGQSSFPWQVAVPWNMKHKKYGDLVQAFMADGSNALCMGLYRTCWRGAGDGAKYVMTNPPMNTVLRGDDLAIVLGTEAFGKDAFEQDLLEGVRGAPSAVDPDDAPPVWAPDSRAPDSRASEKGQSAGDRNGTKPLGEVPPDDVADLDTEEVQLPAMSEMQLELSKAQEELEASQDRELGLRTRIREQEEELALARTRQVALESCLRSREAEAQGTPGGALMPAPFVNGAAGSPADCTEDGANAPRSKWASASLPVSPAACICRNGPSLVTETITK